MTTSVEQPYAYVRRPLVEPDWTRLPGWRDVTETEWRSAQWQRAHCVKNVRQLRDVMDGLLTEQFYADLERDQAERATMSMLLPPEMLNTMVPGAGDELPPAGPEFTEAFLADPVRRYMLPVFSDRRTDWPSHPFATRDSLHEHDMWAVEGLTQTMMWGDGYGVSRPDLYVTSLMDFHRNWRNRANEMSETTKLFTMFGTYIRRYCGSRYYGKAMNQTRLLTAAYDAALGEYDLLMMPTTPIKATELPPPDAYYADDEEPYDADSPHMVSEEGYGGAYEGGAYDFGAEDDGFGDGPSEDD